MKLDDRTQALIAVDSAVGANRHSCLEHHVGRAREYGLPDDEIAEAIDAGKQVLKGAQEKMDRLAADLLGPTTVRPVAASCGCR
jgi:AhpD family alkylhydroperoxidase